MNVLQRIVSLRLYSGKQVYCICYSSDRTHYADYVFHMVYDRLQKMLLCLSRQCTLDCIGKTFDNEVME